MKTISRSSKGTLLFVHGRHYKPQEEVGLELWSAAIRSGLQRDYPDLLGAFDALPIDIAWYGDLNRFVLDSCGKNYDETLDVSDRRKALAALQEIPTRKKFGIRCYDRLPGKSAFPEFIASLLAPVVSTLGLTRFATNLVARDVGRYLDKKSEFGRTVRDRVREKLMSCIDSREPVLLMSHGSGSLVAYDVLWELSHDPDFAPKYSTKKIDLWLTMGSPLGDRGIQKHLKGAKRPAAQRYPNNVIAWHNVAAEDDYCCHDNTLANDFKWLLQQKKISSIDDYKVFNCAVRYGRSNPHSSIGYLIHPRVSKIVADWLIAQGSTPST